MASGRWRIAQVGCGGFGRYHLQVWRKHPAVGEVVVIGRNVDRLAPLVAEFGVATSTDLAAVADADLVDICTPPDTHADLAGVALGHGRPTIVEKPPCRTAAQAMALAAAAGEVPLYGVQNLRFAPLWRRVREAIAEGLVGEPQLSLWPVLCDQTALLTGDDFRADARRGGGALLDGAFHLAYLVPYVLGRPITAVTAWAGQLAAAPPAGEDTGLALWELAGAVAQITYSWAIRHAPRTPAATILGTLGTLLVPRSAKQPLELTRDRETTTVDLGRLSTMPRNDLANCLSHYLDCARQRLAPEATWSDAVAAQRVIEATELAATTGQRIILDS